MGKIVESLSVTSYVGHTDTTPLSSINSTMVYARAVDKNTCFYASSVSTDYSVFPFHFTHCFVGSQSGQPFGIALYHVIPLSLSYALLHTYDRTLQNFHSTKRSIIIK